MGGQVNSAHHPSEGPNPNGERDVVEYRVSGANTLFPNKAWERGSRSYANPINAQARAHTHTLPISEPQETSVIVLQEKENPALKLLTEAVLRAQEEISDVKLDPDFVAGIVKRARIAHSRWIGRKVNICMIYPCYEGIHAGISNQLQSQIYTVLAGVMVGARYIAPVSCGWGRTGYHRDQHLGHFTKKLDQRRLLNFSHFLSRMETLGIQRVESCDNLPNQSKGENTIIHHVNQTFTDAAYEQTLYNYQDTHFPRSPELRVDPAPWPGMVGKRGDSPETFEARFIHGIAKSIKKYEALTGINPRASLKPVGEPLSSFGVNVSHDTRVSSREYNLVVDVHKEAIWRGSADLYVNFKEGPHLSWCDPLFPSALYGTILGAFQLRVPNQRTREKVAYFSNEKFEMEGDSRFAVAHLRIEPDWTVDQPDRVVKRFLKHMKYMNRKESFTVPWILMSGVFTDERLMRVALSIADNGTLSTTEIKLIEEQSSLTGAEKAIVQQLTVLQRLKYQGKVDFVTHEEKRFNDSFGDLELEERAIFQMGLAVKANYFYASTALSSASYLVENLRRLQGKPTRLDSGGYGFGFFNGLRGCSLLTDYQKNLDCRQRPLSSGIKDRHQRLWKEANLTDFECPLRDARGTKIQKQEGLLFKLSRLIENKLLNASSVVH